MTAYTNVYSGELIGEYRAVTETELNISLSITSDNKALLSLELYAVEDGDNEWKEETKGKWIQNNNTFIIKLETGKTIEYQIMTCLPYEEFGYKGCSYGLKPTGGTNSQLLKYGLWKSNDISKLFKKTP
jgi:hypothetical protein